MASDDREIPPSRFLIEARTYEMFRDYIKQEDSLINQRLGWLLTIHGFIYATCGFSLQKRVEIVQKVASDFKAMGCDATSCHRISEVSQSFYFGYDHLGFAVIELDGFLFLLAFIGCIISINMP